MNSKIILATAALALAATSAAAIQPATRTPSNAHRVALGRQSPEGALRDQFKTRVERQLKDPKFNAKVLESIKKINVRPTPSAIAALDEEQGMKTDIIVGVATNLITDAIKNWQKTHSHEEDEAEQGQASEAVARVIKGVLVPLATQWIEDRAHDIGNWVRSLDEDEAVQSVQIDRYIHRMTQDAVAHVMNKAQQEARVALLDEDAEQVAPVLVWIGGVLYKVVEGVVVGIVVDSVVGAGKKLLKGERLWDEDEEQHWYGTSDWNSYQIGGWYPSFVFDEEQSTRQPRFGGYEPKLFDDDAEQGCTMYGCFQLPTSLEEEQKVNWSANAGISGGAGGRPQWNVGIGATWDDEQQGLLANSSRPVFVPDDSLLLTPDVIRRFPPKNALSAPTDTLQGATWTANAGIAGGAGGKPQWKAGVGATWDEENQSLERPGRFRRQAQKFF